MPRHAVLVVDDDDAVRDAVVEVLTAAGFEVVEASSGPAALVKLKGFTPAAAVLDFLMEGMNGAQLARQMQLEIPQLPIVFISGYADTLMLDGVAGAVVLRKPFSNATLTTTVARVLT